MQRRLKLHAPVDLTGIADRTAGWKGQAVSENEARRAIEDVAGKSESNIGGDLMWCFRLAFYRNYCAACAICSGNSIRGGPI